MRDVRPIRYFVDTKGEGGNGLPLFAEEGCEGGCGYVDSFTPGSLAQKAIALGLFSAGDAPRLEQRLGGLFARYFAGLQPAAPWSSQRPQAHSDTAIEGARNLYFGKDAAEFLDDIQFELQLDAVEGALVRGGTSGWETASPGIVTTLYRVLEGPDAYTSGDVIEAKRAYDGLMAKRADLLGRLDFRNLAGPKALSHWLALKKPGVGLWDIIAGPHSAALWEGHAEGLSEVVLSVIRHRPEALGPEEAWSVLEHLSPRAHKLHAWLFDPKNYAESSEFLKRTLDAALKGRSYYFYARILDLAVRHGHPYAMAELKALVARDPKGVLMGGNEEAAATTLGNLSLDLALSAGDMKEVPESRRDDFRRLHAWMVAELPKAYREMTPHAARLLMTLAASERSFRKLVNVEREYKRTMLADRRRAEEYRPMDFRALAYRGPKGENDEIMPEAANILHKFAVYEDGEEPLWRFEDPIARLGEIANSGKDGVSDALIKLRLLSEHSHSDVHLSIALMSGEERMEPIGGLPSLLEKAVKEPDPARREAALAWFDRGLDPESVVGYAKRATESDMEDRAGHISSTIASILDSSIRAGDDAGAEHRAHPTLHRAYEALALITREGVYPSPRPIKVLAELEASPKYRDLRPAGVLRDIIVSRFVVGVGAWHRDVWTALRGLVDEAWDLSLSHWIEDIEDASPQPKPSRQFTPLQRDLFRNYLRDIGESDSKLALNVVKHMLRVELDGDEPLRRMLIELDTQALERTYPQAQATACAGDVFDVLKASFPLAGVMLDLAALGNERASSFLLDRFIAGDPEAAWALNKLIAWDSVPAKLRRKIIDAAVSVALSPSACPPHRKAALGLLVSAARKSRPGSFEALAGAAMTVREEAEVWEGMAMEAASALLSIGDPLASAEHANAVMAMDSYLAGSVASPKDASDTIEPGLEAIAGLPHAGFLPDFQAAIAAFYEKHNALVDAMRVAEHKTAASFSPPLTGGEQGEGDQGSTITPTLTLPRRGGGKKDGETVYGEATASARGRQAAPSSSPAEAPSTADAPPPQAPDVAELAYLILTEADIPKEARRYALSLIIWRAAIGEPSAARELFILIEAAHDLARNSNDGKGAWEREVLKIISEGTLPPYSALASEKLKALR